MNKYILLFLVTFIILINSCTPFFISHDFEIQTSNHKNVAILPFAMNYTGILPDDMLEETFNQIEEAESKAFMISYYNEVLRSTKSGKKPIRVNIQHYQNTLQTFEKNNINIIDTWNMRSEEIAELLQVDAILRGYIEKNQIIPDIQSFGIEIGIKILDIITQGGLIGWIPFDLAKSKEVNTNYNLVDGNNGNTLWSIAYDIEADWRQPANEIIDNVNRRSSKKFPYRID